MIYDISPLLSPETKVWPGDTPLSREIHTSLDRGDHSTVSALHTTVHIGAHTDAPAHFVQGKPTIDQVPLEPYLGPCQLIRVPVDPGGLVTPEMLPEVLEAPRVLFATDSYSGDPAEPFAALDPALIRALEARGVLLTGLDTPSVDLLDSHDHPSHLACVQHGILTLEGLVLTGVPEGLYELIALPLKLAGFDASPVRAILRASR